MKLTLKSKNEAETMQIAKTLATFLNRGDVITLDGDLGVGKTLFTKGIAEGLQIDERVTSPTFTIVKEYEGTMPLYHMDVYRLEFAEEDIGFDEYFYGRGVTVIEWARFIGSFLPEEYLSITIKRTGETNRKISFEAIGDKYKEHLQNLQKVFMGRD